MLKHLIEEYESLHAEKVSPGTRQRMEDIACTPCVSTGTRDVDAALIAARQQLPPREGSLRTAC
ncbi:DUF5133 domain-containing protein [Streptomyces sp. NPDC056437]|uniref:DUF5133 domain-containing protein n=1 Tax=Streptomyces sp. NPDC056437 TaxID=3345816 RepID=UPI0036824422